MKLDDELENGFSVHSQLRGKHNIDHLGYLYKQKVTLQGPNKSQKIV